MQALAPLQSSVSMATENCTLLTIEDCTHSRGGPQRGELPVADPDARRGDLRSRPETGRYPQMEYLRERNEELPPEASRASPGTTISPGSAERRSAGQLTTLREIPDTTRAVSRSPPGLRYCPGQRLSARMEEAIAVPSGQQTASDQRCHSNQRPSDSRLAKMRYAPGTL